MQKRKLWWLLGGLTLSVAAVLMVILGGCAGPQGPAGAVGTAGPPGEATRCKECHNDTSLVLARQIQASNSLHMTGNAFERSQKDCAICHTNEGFTERIKAGKISIEKDIVNPTPPNCRTCHKIHTSYTVQDFSLETTSPVKLELTGTVVDMGKGNLCVNCHQPRWVEKPPEANSTEFEIKSARWEPHHGVESAVIAGVGAYGSAFTGSSVHYKDVKDGCVSCHMANAFGRQAGGHSLNMGYEFHGAEVENVVACASCHKDLKSFDRNGVQTEVKNLTLELKNLLIAKGILNNDTGLAKPGKYPSKLAGAFWNYKLITEDNSNGVHNPQFAKAILKSSIQDAK